MQYHNNSSDQELIQAFQKGNMPALEVLISKHKDRVFNAIYFLVKDKYLAEDIFQDAFIKIIDTLNQGKYNDEGKFLPWVLRIAHNLCVDHFRKVKRTPTITMPDGKDIFDIINVSNSNAESAMMKNQTHKSLHDYLNKLPEDQKEVIILRHFGDLSFKQIADIMGCSINTALGRMRYGLINLRKLMTTKQQQVVA
jgi:RNA polymerase sigma factor (sigma-70 family)